MATSYTKSTDFLWQGPRLLRETQHQPEQPSFTRIYCYEQNSYAPLARIDTAGDDLNSPEVYYFHTDVTGTPKEVTDTNGQIIWQADYTAWGEIDLYRIHQIDQPLRFQGQYADDETGLYYSTFRYYDPHAGRFTTQDPVGLAGGWNLYQYAPNPTGWVDPLGLASCGPSKGFNRRNRITSRWISRLTGKKPADVHDYLTSKGWTATQPQASNKKAIQHIVYVKKTKSGIIYKLDYHPGGSPSQPNIHGNDYWKVYKSSGKGTDEVLGRIGYGNFKNYDLIKGSPVYIDGLLMNGG